MDERGDYKMEHVANSGKHSVEVNIRIRRAHGERKQTPPIFPMSCSTPTPHATPTPPRGSMNYNTGSWADLFSRRQNHDLAEGNLNNLGTMPRIPQQDKEHQRKAVNTGTQTEQAPPVAAKVDPKTTAQNKEYVETINQLHQLCSKLKAEVSALNHSKDRMESNLLGIIREKDVIISSYHNAQARTPVPVPSKSVSTSTSPEELSVSKVQRNKFRTVVHDIRGLINQELDELKLRQATASPPTHYLKSLFRSLRLDDTDDVGGGGDGNNLSTAGHTNVSRTEKGNDDTIGNTSLSSSASSVVTGHFSKDLMDMDLDISPSPTEYLKLPYQK